MADLPAEIIGEQAWYRDPKSLQWIKDCRIAGIAKNEYGYPLDLQLTRDSDPLFAVQITPHYPPSQTEAAVLVFPAKPPKALRKLLKKYPSLRVVRELLGWQKPTFQLHCLKCDDALSVHLESCEVGSLYYQEGLFEGKPCLDTCTTSVRCQCQDYDDPFLDDDLVLY